MSDTRSKQRAPSGLGKPARALWRAVTAGLVLRADELAILETACRTRDQIASLEQLLVASPAAIEGSRGQQVLHPAIAELRLQRQLLAALLAKLDMPEAAGGTAWDGLSTSARGRKAALHRWHPKSA